MAESDPENGRKRRPPNAADLSAEPEAGHWALNCAWVPGTGHCRNRPCSEDCPFRDQRRAEANRIEHERRQRRRDQRAFAQRTPRLN